MSGRRRVGGLALLPGLLLALAVGGYRGAIAQDATPTAATAAAEGHPGHVHAGDCENPGAVVAPLTNATAPSGEAVGQAAAIPAATSVTTVPMALTDMLAADHAVDFHRSAAAIEPSIACGEIGGTLDEAGDLAIGLKEVDGSGYVGVAFLSPNDVDPAQTDVSVFLAEGLAGAAAGGIRPGTPEAAGGLATEPPSS